MKQKYLFLAVFFSIVSFSNKDIQLNVKTGATVSPIFKFNDKKTTTLEKVSYNVKLLDLNFKFKDNIYLETVLKSSRENSKINDWDGDTEHDFDSNKRNKNHDLMAKFKIGYVSPIFYNTQYLGDITYYLDDFNAKRVINKDNKEVTDVLRKSEYIEDDGKKQALGNLIFNNSLKGNLKDTKFDLSLNFKTNQFNRFDVDESYLKTNVDINQKIYDKFNFNFIHKFDYDLNFSHKKFDPFKTDLTEFPDFMGGKYVTKFDNDIKINFDYLKSYFIKTDLNINTFLIGKETYEDSFDRDYSVYKPKISLEIDKKINNKVNILSSFNNDFEIKHARYYGNKNKIDEKDTQVAYKPKFKIGAKYDNSIKNVDIKTLNKFSYGIDMTIAKFVTPIDKLGHNIAYINKTEIKYKPNEKFDLSLKLDLDQSLNIQNNILKPSKGKIDLIFNLNNKYSEKLTQKIEIKNNFKSKTEEKVLNYDDFSNIFSIKNELNYNILENLKLKNEVYLENSSDFKYYLSKDYKKVNEYNNEKKSNKKLIFLGYSVNVKDFTKIGTKNNISYEKNILDNLKLTFNTLLNAQLDLLAIKMEKVFHYKKDDIKNDKMIPKISDNIKKKYNVGGKIEIEPSIDLKYNILEKLTLNANLKINTLFEKKVDNLIKDDYRPDKGLFGPIDKEFKFRKITPSITFGLEYKF